eukprot:evm.model.scf_158.4 EVM.evm.TU.scf_158.4   scf_158:36980-48133(-)
MAASGAPLSALLPILILAWAGLSVGQAGVNFQPTGDSRPVSCPTPISNYAELHHAVACGGDGCANISCDTILLDTFNAFAYGPPDAGSQLPVLRNVTVTSAGHVLWKMGHDDGDKKAVTVQQGVTLSLKNMTVEANPTVSTEAFLLPAVLTLAGPSSALVLENVTLLTSKDIVREVLEFAEDNLSSRDYRETQLPSGEEAVIIEDYEGPGLAARDVTISHWEFPKRVDAKSLRGQGISDPNRLVVALHNWDVVLADHLDILADLILEPSLFVDKNNKALPPIVIQRNVSVLGQQATHANFAKVPLLDFGLVEGAVKVEGGATVKFENLELLNLALGPMDMHYGFLMWFLDFDRMSSDTTVIIDNSAMVVSCRELEHFEYAVALLNDPLQTLLPPLPNLTLDSSDWNISRSPDGIIMVEKGKAFALEMRHVNLTCRPSHGNLLDVDFMLDSPLETTSTDLGPPSSEAPPVSASSTVNSETSSSSSSVGTSSTLFKVGLGVLVPCIAVLGCLLVWKCRSNMRLKPAARNVQQNDSEKQLKGFDMEGGAEAPEPPPKNKKKSVKHSMSDSFEEDKLDQLPALSHEEGMGRLGHDSLKLTPSAIGGSHATEFIPDILKVSNDIDDKQLVVKELLGQGQNGSVHKGVWRELEVAVKTIVFRGEGNKDFHQQAIREVAITSGLAHPNVVCTYSYDIKRLQPGSLEARVQGLKNKSGVNILDSYVDWKLFIIQEYCEKGTLRVALRDRAFLDPQTEAPDLKSLLEIAMGIAKGMHHIHSKNILHGNLKPSNVLLKSAPETHTRMLAKVADFGLSLKMSGEQTHVSNVQKGDPFYMSREVMEEGSSSKAADIYAFGVVLWEMYMSQLSPSGKVTDEMFQLFPRLPWSCPAMYGVLAAACMHPVPSARPKFSDCMSFLQTLWHQQRLGALTPGSAVSSRERLRDIGDAMVSTSPKLQWGGTPSQPSGGREWMQDPEFQRSLEKSRAHFQKCLAKMPPVFRTIEYEAVYWSGAESSQSPRWHADE